MGGMAKAKLTKLGKKTVLTAKQIADSRGILEVFPNPCPSRDYEIELVFPEFTSVCPVTGQPDFATIVLRYVPDKVCVEMKSLKLYYFSFRNKGIFYEAVTNRIADDLIAVMKPRKLTIEARFNPRGGTGGNVKVEYGGK